MFRIPISTDLTLAITVSFLKIFQNFQIILESFLSQYSLKMRPFKNHTWNSPGLQTEPLLIEELFLKLISNSAFDHLSIILHFYLHWLHLPLRIPLKSAILMEILLKTQKILIENFEQSNKTPKNSSQKLMGVDSLHCSIC